MIFTGCYVSMAECTCPGDTGYILHGYIELVNSISFYQALPTAYGTIPVNTCHSRFTLGMTMASSRWEHALGSTDSTIPVNAGDRFLTIRIRVLRCGLHQGMADDTGPVGTGDVLQPLLEGMFLSGSYGEFLTDVACPVDTHHPCLGCGGCMTGGVNDHTDRSADGTVPVDAGDVLLSVRSLVFSGDGDHILPAADETVSGDAWFGRITVHMGYGTIDDVMAYGTLPVDAGHILDR